MLFGAYSFMGITHDGDGPEKTDETNKSRTHIIPPVYGCDIDIPLKAEPVYGRPESYIPVKNGTRKKPWFLKSVLLEKVTCGRDADGNPIRPVEKDGGLGCESCCSNNEKHCDYFYLESSTMLVDYLVVNKSR